MEEKTINVFLASSTELSDDREFFSSFVRRMDKTFQKMGSHLRPQMWEDLDASWKGHREQDDYNELIRKSQMFLALFYKEAGKFTIEEFDVAIEKFNQTKQTPKIYVYKKTLQKGEQIDTELEDFQKRLEEMGLYWTTYSSQDSLHLHFLQQLLIVYADGLSNLKVEDGTVKLWDMDVAKMSNLPFAADNKEYNQLKKELEKLPNEIEKARKRSEKNPDDEDLRDELQEKLNRYNNKKEEFARLQQTLFDTSQRIATMQRENLNDKLRRATKAFESGNLAGANALLDEIAIEAETHHANLEQDRALVHQDIEAFLLQAKTKMAEVNTPIEDRIKEVHGIYVKADQWAKDSALPDAKLDGLLYDYGRFLNKYGKYKEAEQVYLRLVSLRERMLGKEHPDTAESYNNIGLIYKKQGDYTKALDYYQKTLDTREKVLGKEHPSTATTYNNIGLTYHSQGDYTKALEYHFKALDIREKVLGKEHPDTATTYNNIGGVYDSQGDYTKALEYYFKALDIVKKVLGEEHPYTASSYNNIGSVYYSQGDYTKALEYHFKALDIREKVLGKEHPSTATSYNNIGGVYKSQGDYTKALEYYFKALDIVKNVLGEEHPDTATSYNNIGLTYHSQGNYPKALEYYFMDLAISEKVLGKEHPSTATTYNNIGGVYDSQGDYTKALEYYFKDLAISEKVLGKEHPSTASSYNNIGLSYGNLGDYPKALEYLQKALDIVEKVLGPTHPYAKITRKNIEICQSKINDTGWSLTKIIRRLFK